MPDFLRPIVARLVGVAVAWFVTWLGTKYNIILSEDEQGRITQGAVNALLAILAVYSVVYAVVHKGVSVKTNPSDAATPTLAAEGKAEEARLNR